MKKNPLRAAVVGVGYLGRFHAQKYRANSAIKDLWVCDARQEQAKAVAQELQAQACFDPRDLIGKVDLVTVAASTQAHFQLGQFFIENNIPVLIEKPLAATLDQAQKLVDLATSRRVPVAVGHIERFNPCLRELKSKIQNASYFELIRHTGFRARGADVSVLHDLMIHDLDLLTWLGGAPLNACRAFGASLITKDWDLCDAEFELANGKKGRISVSRVSSLPQRMVRVVDQACHWRADTANLVLEKITPVSIAAAEPLLIEKQNIEKQDALQKEVDSFIEAVQSGKTPFVTATDGLQALQDVALVEEALVASGLRPGG